MVRLDCGLHSQKCSDLIRFHCQKILLLAELNQYCSSIRTISDQYARTCIRPVWKSISKGCFCRTDTEVQNWYIQIRFTVHYQTRSDSKRRILLCTFGTVICCLATCSLCEVACMINNLCPSRMVKSNGNTVILLWVWSEQLATHNIQSHISECHIVQHEPSIYQLHFISFLRFLYMCMHFLPNLYTIYLYRYHEYVI